MSFSNEVAAYFQKQTDKSGMTTADFAATLLEAIARDKLYDAAICYQGVSPY